MPPKLWTIGILATIALFFLYFFGLSRTGLLGPDEPRYAAIGREMAQSGDWVTPRLYGRPWFEKPALLYWMTATGFKLGLGDDLSPRLPVAIVSAAFLIFYFFNLRGQFGGTAAAFATCILATSAGWLAYSHIAVTDLPMSAAFAAAMLLALRGSFVPAGILLGLAVLAKGLVPLALFIPALWFLKKRPRGIATVLGLAVVVALPWYAMVTARNGAAFIDEFFWKHHFQRIASGTLGHVRPFWFYVPVLLAGIFPWTPALALLFMRKMFGDRRVQYLAAWSAFGFLFFSLSQNKLPGYLLPLLPAVAALCGLALTESPRTGWVLASCAILLWLVPAIEPALPGALLSGLSHTHVRLPFAMLIPVLAVAALCWFLDRFHRRELAVAAIAFCVVVAVTQIVWTTYPVLDERVSARFLVKSVTCSSNINRSWKDGIDYYAHRPIPDCK